ncbi:MAG: RluA family pseudouridine synthase [Archangium sp.]
MTTLRILVQREGLVAVDKPPGLLVIPGRTPEDQVCAKDILGKQLGTQIWVCHRIDRDTSGVLLFATTAEAHRNASMAFEAGEARKKYLAIVEGAVTSPIDIDTPMTEARKGKMRVVFPDEQGGKEARTLVRPLRSFDGGTLVECEPLTGRQHQIRVHLKSVGHPLMFDHQYGRKEPVTRNGITLSRTPLHAAELKILGLEVTSPLPDELERFST